VTADVTAKELLGVALDAARPAAAMVRKRRPVGRVAVTATKSSPTDPVTELDSAAERVLRSVIGAARPHDGFLGEEGGADHGSTGVRWVLDPIDGTVNFIYGIPAYAVSVAAEVNGVVVAGVVLDIVAREEYTAVQGGGAFLRYGPDGDFRRQLRVPAPPPLARALVATGFGYDAGQRARQAHAIARLLPRVRDIRRIGAASLDLCSLAAGRVDAYVEEGLHAWDLAAGALICREAGAIVTGLDDDEPSERLVVASAAARHEDFRALVRECGF